MEFGPVAMKFYYRKKPESTLLLRLDNKYVVVFENYIKYLGLTLSSLMISAGIDNIASRLPWACYLISMEILFWGGCSHAERILILQKRAVRTRTKEEYLSLCKQQFS